MGKRNAFTINVKGQARLLFWVEEQSSGDLTIIVKNAPFANLPADIDKLIETPPWLHEPATQPGVSQQVVEQHISIHRSTKSPTHINAVTWRMKAEIG